MTDIVKTVQSSNKNLDLTEQAKVHLLKQLSKKTSAIGVRLSLSKTGCSGLSYVFDFIEQENDDDRKISFDELSIYIENKSYPFLKGLKIDFVKDGLNNKYIYQNPNQTGECGCGESFTID